jgi:2-polyprenyl-3-methyl-5-hydroxy-6-metoxy-1,4-benzoquinol methylase
MKKLADKYHISIFNDGRDYNVIGGKYLDFQGFHLPENYQEELKQRVTGVANIGKWGPWMNYHDIPELEITGGRKNQQRIREMKLYDIDFKDKTVLDVGCSEGFFCRYAIDRGAKNVVGIDLPGLVEPVAELTYYLGYYNIDFWGFELNKVVTMNVNFDIVLFLSMVQHIGFPNWLKSATKELLIYEGNSKDRDREAEAKIKTDYSSYKVIGKTTDLFDRPVLWVKP